MLMTGCSIAWEGHLADYNIFPCHQIVSMEISYTRPTLFMLQVNNPLIVADTRKRVHARSFCNHEFSICLQVVSINAPTLLTILLPNQEIVFQIQLKTKAMSYRELVPSSSIENMYLSHISA